MHPPHRRLAVLAAATGLLVAAPVASAYQVGAAQLDLSSVNSFNDSTGRTWLGYLSTLSGGGASPIAPATGPTVTPASPKGGPYTWTFMLDAAQGGSYDPATGDTDVELAGGLDYDGSGHGFRMTLKTPRIVIDGASRTGQLYASGTNPGSMAGDPPRDYDRAKPVFDLDLSGARTETADGVTTISGIAPAIHEGGYAYPDNYERGAGPERDPNTFGTLALRVSETDLPMPPAVDPPAGETPAGETPAGETPAAEGGVAVAPPAPPAPPAAAPGTPAAPVTAARLRAPKVSRVTLRRRALTFRLDRAATVTATVRKRAGKRWKRVRVVERDVRRAATVRLNPRLRGTGRFRVVVRSVGATGRKGKPVVATARLR